MKQLYLLVFLVIGVVFVCKGQPDNTMESYKKQINRSIQSGDASAFSAYFKDMVELVINQSAETYSKTQATAILQDFFRENAPAQFEMEQTWKEDDMIHVVAIYTSVKDVQFRFYYGMRGRNDKKDKPLIYNINIEQIRKCKPSTTQSKK